MTIKLPPERKNGILDRVLKIFGKEERQLVIPGDVYEKFGEYVIVQAQWEGFWRCLLRRKSSGPEEVEEILAEAEGEVEKKYGD
jgi:hypothetical protein